ncbi:MAG: histidinol dehydrogenase [candidate division WOR-3 bacterium]
MKIIKYREIKEDFFEYKKIEDKRFIQKIIKEIKEKGDKALIKYTKKYDKVSLKEIKVSQSEIENAYRKAKKEDLKAIEKAAKNIKKFSEKQKEQFKDFEFEIQKGVFTGQRVIPIERIGIYVPSGNFPLVSTLIMCAIPAQVAGVSEIAVVSPPRFENSIHPLILATAYFLKIKEIYKIGGIQAIAALAYGTESIKKVDKIVGPGSKYVASAKKEVFGDVGIDFIAGPTEIMIIADESGEPELIAMDLLSQAEHDKEAFPILATTSKELASKVIKEINKQIENLQTKEIARVSIENKGLIVLLENMEEGIIFANKMAPEHLELHIKNPKNVLNKLRNYGSLFIGKYSVEALGDYSSGLNHTLPTNTASKYTGGLGVKDFLKLQTTLRVTKEGFKEIGPIAEKLAEIEGLSAHKNSIKIRYSR